MVNALPARNVKAIVAEAVEHRERNNMKSFQVHVFSGYLRRTARATITFHAVFTICLRAFYELVRCETVEAAGTACRNQILLATTLGRMGRIP